MKNFISTLLLTWVLLPFGLAQAETINPELLQGEEISVNGKSYQLLSKVRAVKIPHCNAIENGPNQLENLGIDGNRFLTARQNLAVYEIQTAQNAFALDTTAQGAKRYPVVYNPHTKDLAVVTGKLSVKLTSNAHANAVASRIKLPIARQTPHLRLVTFEVSPQQDIAKVVKRLKKDHRIKRVRVDLLRNVPKPQ